MPQKRTGFTTLVDLEEFDRISWVHLANIKMTWQYDGMANLFREAGIPLYGVDRGTMKMNHPVMFMALPQHRDKNYGVDIYVPIERKREAARLIADEALVRERAEAEAAEGKAARDEFDRAALAAKQRNDETRKRINRERRASHLSALTPGFLARGN